jgi:hypothetical protein
MNWDFTYLESERKKFTLRGSINGLPNNSLQVSSG